MRSLLLLSLLAGAALVVDDAHAGERGPKPTTNLDLPDYSLTQTVFDFPTGLRIIMQSDRSYPIASVFMIVNHGSADDPPGKDETAHFVEHTWFRSVHGDLPPIMDVVQDLGGVFNATTRNDWTDYRTTGASQNLKIMLRLESLRLTEFYKGMTEEQTDVEREVIRNEWRRRNEQNTALLFDYLFNVVYPESHPYHSTSTHDTIDNITLDDLKEYVDKYYKPENTTIMVVGDFDPGDAASLIFETFDLSLLDPRLTEEMLFRYPKPGIKNPDPNNPDHWRYGAYDPVAFARGEKKPYVFPKENRPPRITEERDPVPPLGTKEVVRRKAPVDHPIAVLGWSLPGGFRSDNFELVMVGNLASAYLASGLPSAFGNPDAFGDVGCFTQTEVIHSTLMCLAEIKDKSLQPERVLEKMLDQFAEMYNPEQRQLLDLQFSRSRMENLAQQLLSLDTVATIFGGRADNIGTYAHFTSDVQYYKRSMEQIFKMNPARIIDIAYEYVKRDRAARLVVEPLPEEEIDVASNESGYIGASAGDDQSLRTSDDLSKITPEALEATYLKPDLSKLVDTKLPNGLRVVAIKHGEAPLVQASLLIGGGPYTVRPSEYDFVTNFTRGPGVDPLQYAGSTSYPYFKNLLGEAFDRPLLTQRWGNATRIDIKVPSSRLDGALWLLREEVEGLAPNLDGVGEWKSQREKSLKSNWRKLEWHLSDLQTRHLFPDAPWHHAATWEGVQTAKTFNASTIQTWLADHVRPDNAVLLIVGNVDAAQAKRLAEVYFGGWEGSSKGKPGWKGTTRTPSLPTEPTKVYLFDDKERTQSDVDLLCRLDFRGEADRAAVNVLGSLAGARTFGTLRVKEGLAYSPTAFAYVQDDGSALLRYTSLAVNKGVGRTVEFFLETTKAIHGGDIDEQEVLLHKLRLAREIGIVSQSTDQLANRLTTPLRLGLGWDVIEDGGKRIAEVDAAQIQRLVGPCAEHAVVTIRGPKDIVAPQLEERGIAYEVVDPKKRGDELYEAADPKGFAKYAAKREKEEAKKKAQEAKEQAKNEKKKK